MTARIIRHFLVASAFALTGCGNDTDTSGGQQHTASITVSLDDQSIFADAGTSASAVYRDPSGAPIAANFTWSSSNESVATVNASGKISGVTPGSTVITASTLGVNGTANLNVTTSPVARINLISTQLQVSLGLTNEINAVAFDSQNRAISGITFVYTTSNAAVVSVSPTGTVTGNALGSATITATVGSKSASTVVTVISAR